MAFIKCQYTNDYLLTPKQNSQKKVCRRLRITSAIPGRPLCLAAPMPGNRWMRKPPCRSRLCMPVSVCWQSPLRHCHRCPDVLALLGALHTERMGFQIRLSGFLPPPIVSTLCCRAGDFWMERQVLLTVEPAGFHQLRAAGMMAWCLWSVRHFTFPFLLKSDSIYAIIMLNK